MTIGHWKTLLPIPPDFFGFIYKITNLANQKTYIGRKQRYYNITKPPLKSQKCKRKMVVESNWTSYQGSSKTLNADIDLYGKELFRFEILRFCQSKKELSYWEAYHILSENALFNPLSYNEFISLKLRNPK